MNIRPQTFRRQDKFLVSEHRVLLEEDAAAVQPVRTGGHQSTWPVHRTPALDQHGRTAPTTINVL